MTPFSALLSYHSLLFLVNLYLESFFGDIDSGKS
jgi:hypothetical protein